MATSHHIERLDELGHRVRVGPGDPEASDVLEYASLLIQTEGWNQINASGNESSQAAGWTLHDAIGESCRRLSATGPSNRGSKDASYTTGEGISVSLRQGAQAAVDAELERMRTAGEWTPAGQGRLDYEYNDDQGRTQDEIIAVLDRAREAV